MLYNIPFNIKKYLKYGELQIFKYHVSNNNINFILPDYIKEPFYISIYIKDKTFIKILEQENIKNLINNFHMSNIYSNIIPSVKYLGNGYIRIMIDNKIINKIYTPDKVIPNYLSRYNPYRLLYQSVKAMNSPFKSKISFKLDFNNILEKVNNANREIINNIPLPHDINHIIRDYSSDFREKNNYRISIIIIHKNNQLIDQKITPSNYSEYNYYSVKTTDDIDILKL
jgi:hypothetical protein